MMRHQTDNLIVEISESSSFIERIRRRPAGFSTLIHESLSTSDRVPLHATELPQITYVTSPVPTPFARGLSPLAARRQLQITSNWCTDDGLRVLRIFQTPQEGVGPVSLFKFEYQIEASGPTQIQLFRVRNIFEYVFENNCFQLQGHPYRVHLGLDSNVPIGASINEVAVNEKSREVALVCHLMQPTTIHISALIISNEQMICDSSVIIAPPRMDSEMFVVVGLSPSIFFRPLSRDAAQRPIRPSPLVIYGATTDEDAIVRHLDSLVCTPEDLVRAVSSPPREYPYGAVVRRNLATLFYVGPGTEIDLKGITSILAEPNVETRRVIMTGLSDQAQEPQSVQYNNERRFTVLTGSRSADDIQAVLRKIDHELHDITTDGMNVNNVRQIAPVEMTLEPIHVPLTADAASTASLLLAARIRGTWILEQCSTSSQPWPEPALQTDHPRPVDVAWAVLSDLVADAELTSAVSRAEYDCIWRRAWERLHAGESRADRIVLVSIGGIHEEFDRLKLMAPILHSTSIPAPVVPIQLRLADYLAFRKVFSKHLELLSENLEDALHHTSSLTPSIDRALSTSSELVRRSLEDLIPEEVRHLLRTTRPKEIVNYSWLPLEWLELDGIPLGYLTKVSSLRSSSPLSDLGHCGDLGVVSTAAVDAGAGTRTSISRVLLVGPTYSGQPLVNNYTQRLSATIAKALRKQLDIGRELEIVELTGSVQAAQLKDELAKGFRLLFYVGHATGESLELTDGKLLIGDCDGHFSGGTCVLVGCNTFGATSLTGSITSHLMARGVSAVFSTYYTIPLALAEQLIFNLSIDMISNNYRFCDAAFAARSNLMWSQWPSIMAQSRDLRVRKNVAFLGPNDIGGMKHLDAWDKEFHEARQFFSGQEQEKLLARSASCGLVLALSGDLRKRAFAF